MKKIINRYLLPTLEFRQIKDIKYSELASLYSTLDVSPKTKNNILSPIRMIFEMAYIDGDIEVNPAAKLKCVKSQKEPPDPFCLNEVELIIENLEKYYSVSILNYFEFAFFTGLRISELIALKWEDINWHDSLIRVQRAKVEQKIKKTKTNLVRDVEMNSRVLTVLKRQKK